MELHKIQPSWNMYKRSMCRVQRNELCINLYVPEPWSIN